MVSRASSSIYGFWNFGRGVCHERVEAEGEAEQEQVPQGEAEGEAEQEQVPQSEAEGDT